MVSAFKRRTKRQEWPSKNMYEAVEAVRSNRMGYLKAAKFYLVQFIISFGLAVRATRGGPIYDRNFW